MMTFFSHIGQDQWIDEVLNHKRDGFFLDFGTFDGITTSNTFFLEKTRGWRGICVEPNPFFYSMACAVRSCITVNCALWPESRLSLEFLDAHGLSSFLSLRDEDKNSKWRNQSAKKIIKVDTLNPTELLQRFSAPKLIDYLSLDVEGAEFEVLSSIDLGLYEIALMTIEHNHDIAKQHKIRGYLSKFGYDVVDLRNDDLFFHRDILRRTAPNGRDPIEVRNAVLERYHIKD